MLKDDLISEIKGIGPRSELGESYFDQLDEIIKTNLQVMENLVAKAEYPIVASGSFCSNLIHNGFDVEIVVCGGLRVSRKLDLTSYKDKIKGNTFTFIDDSFYKGRTAIKIQKEILRLGGKIDQILVGYDDMASPIVESIITREDLNL